MKNIFQTKNSQNGIIGVATLALLIVPMLASAQSFTPITSTLDLGAKGTNVTNLQYFFAANPAIYPEGLVTGYFGALTRSAVMTFQTQYGIVSSGSAATTGFGRVGPSTLNKINDLIAHGGWTLTDTAGPAFYNVSKTLGTTQLTFTFNTNEGTSAYVVYNTSPLRFNEGNENSSGFGAIGGSVVNSTSNMSTFHSITIPNLSSNTTYYYTVIVTDAAGNVSVFGPNNSARTNQ